MTHILAIQPDRVQSGALRHVLRRSANAEITVVDSMHAALSVIDSQLPDLILLHAFIPPADADDLVAYLRMLPDADHLQTIFIPLIETSSPCSRSLEGHGWCARLRHYLLGGPQRPGTSVIGCDPQVFAADVAGYLSRTHSIREEIEYRRADDELLQTSDRRRARRWFPLEVPFVSPIRLAKKQVRLINISAGGALIRTDVRPHPRRALRPESLSQSGSALTLHSPSGEEIRQTGRAVRCHARSIGDGRVMYEVAFRFDESLDLMMESGRSALGPSQSTVGDAWAPRERPSTT